MTRLLEEGTFWQRYRPYFRFSEQEMEEGDLAVHGHEVYPSDVPSLGYPSGIPGWVPAPAGGGGEAPPTGGAGPPT